MPTDLAIQCSCGALRGGARGLCGRVGHRVVCYCDDCQCFAHFLGRASDVLDAHGGTDIFQVTPARVALSEGRAQLACMRLTPKGLLRWYAGCCRTPIGSTLATRQVPFVGLVHACLRLGGGGSLDAALGPVRARVFGRFAKGDPAGLGASQGAPLPLLLRPLRLFVAARLRGDHRRSPFFDPESGEPRVAPHVLGADELRRVRSAQAAA